jgi:hypothetical protein
MAAAPGYRQVQGTHSGDCRVHRRAGDLDAAKPAGELGTAYAGRLALTGDRADEQAALAAYTAALEVTGRQDNPALWAILQNNIGTLLI